MSDNVIETLKFNCTICPSECLLTVEVERDADGAVAEVRSVTGNRCPRGDKFAHQELTCPCACSPQPWPYLAATRRCYPCARPKPSR